MKRPLLLSLAMALIVTGLSALSACNGANDSFISILANNHTGGKIEWMARGSRSRPFGLFVPVSYKDNASQRYPVIIFLHGMGEGGNDAHANLRVGLAPFVAKSSNEFQFICIFPQSENGQWDENSEAAADVITELDQVLKEYPAADPDRVSLTGLSTGGYGTWAIGAKYRDRFAALVPMGSSASAEGWASSLVHMPIRSYHNSGDMFAGSGNDRDMVAKLQTLGNTNCRYTEYGAMGHDCWEAAYGDGELFSWLLSQRRSNAAAPGMTHRTTSITPVAPASASPSSPSGPAAIVPVVSPVANTPVRGTSASVTPKTPY